MRTFGPVQMTKSLLLTPVACALLAWKEYWGTADEKAVFLMFLLSSSAAVALAHSGATGIVKERMQAMKMIAQATKALARLNWSNVDETRRQAGLNAAAVAVLAADIERLFPNTSIHGPSEAVEAIWERPDDFARLARALKKAANELAAVAAKANSHADIQAPFDAIGATCKQCHRDFRKKK